VCFLEYNDDSRGIYEKNFYKENASLFSSGNFGGDITKIDEQDIPVF
jgi:hypothetical protein